MMSSVIDVCRNHTLCEMVLLALVMRHFLDLDPKYTKLMSLSIEQKWR